MNSIIEKEVGDALLDVGVSLPFIDFRFPFTNKKFTLKLIMKRPCMGNQIRIAKHYMQLGVTYKEMKAFTKDEEFAFLAKQGKRVSKMVALTICRGFFTGYLFSPVVAWLLRWFVPRMYWYGANMKFIQFLGTKDFMITIRFAQAIRILKPNLSQLSQGS